MLFRNLLNTVIIIIGVIFGFIVYHLISLLSIFNNKMALKLDSQFINFLKKYV